MKDKLNRAWIEIKKKAYEALAMIKRAFFAVVNFMKENPLVAVALIGLAKSLLTNSSRLISQYHDRERHDRGFFDRRKGKWSYAKKTPNRYQLEEIEWRYNNGESYRSILDDLGILKTR